jgi:hypothetical protein
MMTSSHEEQGGLPLISYHEDMMPSMRLDTSETGDYLDKIDGITDAILKHVLTGNERELSNLEISDLTISDEVIYSTTLVRKDESGRTTKRLSFERRMDEKIITIEEIEFCEEVESENSRYKYESFSVSVNNKGFTFENLNIPMHSIELVGGEDLVSDFDYVPLRIDSTCVFDRTSKRWLNSVKDYNKVTAYEYDSMVSMLERFLK